MYNIKNLIYVNINRRQVLFVVLTSFHGVQNFPPWLHSYSSVTSVNPELGGNNSELKIRYFQYVNTVDWKTLKNMNANKK